LPVELSKITGGGEGGEGVGEGEGGKGSFLSIIRLATDSGAVRETKTPTHCAISNKELNSGDKMEEEEEDENIVKRSFACCDREP
jgi:hypothetical protein